MCSSFVRTSSPLTGLASSPDSQCPEPLGVGSRGGAEAAGEVAEGAGPPAAGRAE